MVVVTPTKKASSSISGKFSSSLSSDKKRLVLKVSLSLSTVNSVDTPSLQIAAPVCRSRLPGSVKVPLTVINTPSSSSLSPAWRLLSLSSSITIDSAVTSVIVVATFSTSVLSLSSSSSSSSSSLSILSSVICVDHSFSSETNS